MRIFWGRIFFFFVVLRFMTFADTFCLFLLLGLPAPFKPKNRFDVIHWQYFTATHLYFDSDYSNEKELKGKCKSKMEYFNYSNEYATLHLLFCVNAPGVPCI